MPPSSSPPKHKTRTSARRSSQAASAAQSHSPPSTPLVAEPSSPEQQRGDSANDVEIKGDEENAAPRPQSSEEDHFKSVINETRSILASLAPTLNPSHALDQEPITAFQIPPESLSLHAIRDQLLAKADRSKRLLFAGDEGESPSKRRRSSLSQILGEGELDIDWAIYKDWPEGIAKEEVMMLDYFRKLKFIYLEQETKMRFLADVQDDIENGTEATVYSAAEVAERERTAKSLKSQLVEAKSLVRSLRAKVDAAAEKLVEPWQQVEQDSKEAEKLVKEIGDMELELAKIRAQSHGKGNVAAIAGKEGSLTTAEAEEVCDAQIQEMTTLEERTTAAQQAIEKTKKELVASLKSLDRLNAERSAAEKYAAEAKLGMGRDGGRDLETERLCASHTTTLALLKSLLGLEEVEAVDGNEIRLVYRLPVVAKRDKLIDKTTRKSRRMSSKSAVKESEGDSSVAVHLRFQEVGGRIANVEVFSAQGEPVELSEASTSRLRALQEANDIPLIVQEVLSAV
ncbi:hypothetical protein ACQY0O_004526 [Thecaphora frezii]